jgi:hypothetical protein
MDPLTPEYPLRRVVIYLIGVPAVGKYTIAAEIRRLTGARVVDNQLINLPVFSVLGYDGKDSFPFPPGAWKHVEAIRTAVLATIREHCGPEDSFVFTNVLQAGCASDEALFHGIEQLATDRGSRFYPVWLSCFEEKLRVRKDTLDRRARLKDTDLANISDYLRASSQRPGSRHLRQHAGRLGAPHHRSRPGTQETREQ